MSGDISDSAKVGIGVLLLCFLIGIVFNVFTMVRSTATKGTNQLQGSMNQMVDATYASYDNETVFGTAVINAIATYGQDKMCMVVDNRPRQNNLTDNNPIQPTTPTDASTSMANVNVTRAFYYGYGLSAAPENNGSWYQGTLQLNTAAVNGSRSLDSSYTKILGNTHVYVNTQNRYAARLIKDTTDQIIGIYFTLQP